MEKHPLAALADYISTMKIGDLPCSVKEAAIACCIDTIAAGVGGSVYEEVPAVIAECLHFSAEQDQGSHVWGTHKRTSVFMASFLNGMMSHALELDDVHLHSKAHIGAVVVPAAWSVGESLGVSGEKLLESVIAGYETMARIGKGFGVTEHRMRGWHVSGTAGTFGAAAATAKLLDLTPEKTLFALGLAGSQSSGLWAFLQDGATSKKLNTGRAAENGVAAAVLAKAGMTGPMHILDASDGGLYVATSDGYSLEEVGKDLGSTYEILHLDRKPYPCCRSMHSALDAILKIQKIKKVPSEQIRKIRIRSYDVGVRQCGMIKYPLNVSGAKFCMRFAVAVGYIEGTVGQKQFSMSRINDPEVRKLAEKIEYDASDEFSSLYPEKWGSFVQVEFTDGTSIEEKVLDPLGSVENQLTSIQLKHKFIDLTSPVLGSEKTENLLNDLINLDKIKHFSSVCQIATK